MLYVPEAQGSLARGGVLYCMHEVYARELLACRTYTLGVVRYTTYRARCTPGYTLLKLNNNMPLCSEVSVGRRAERANRTSDNESEGTPLTAS